MKRSMQSPQRRDAARRTVQLRTIAAAFILSTLLVGLDTVAWFRLQRSLDRQLDRFALAAHASGWRFSAQAGERSGWPLAATLTLIRPSLRGGTGLVPGGIAWSGESVVLSLSLLHPHRATVLAQGTQELSVAPGSSMPLPLRFWAARIALWLPADAGHPADNTLVLDADALHVAAPGAGPDDIARLAGLTARVRWRADAAAAAKEAATDPMHDAASLSVLLRDIALPARAGTGDGRVLQRARLEARLDGRIDTRSMPLPDALASWRGSGGRLRIEEASVDWGPSSAAAGGEFGLGADGAAEGRLDLVLSNPDELLQQLRNAGLVGPGRMVAMRAVIGLIGAGQPGPRVHLPLQLRGGTLGIGELPLLRIGAIGPPSSPAAR